MEPRNPQSRNEGDEQADARSGAIAWLKRELDLGLEIVPAVGRSQAACANDVRKASGSPVGLPLMERRRAEDRPQVREFPAPLVEGAVREAGSLEALQRTLEGCLRCKLSKGRTNIVFGVGNPSAELMFIGEAPGEDEDRQGIPFVGRAGALLTDIITKGMGLRREDVYIANVVKCRPPQNRNPEPDEIVACEPFLHRQIALIRPRVLVTLGKFATQALLRTPTPISKLRGTWHDYQGVPLMPTFHPAYLLRNPSDKRLVWEDIKQVMVRLELPVRAPR